LADSRQLTEKTKSSLDPGLRIAKIQNLESETRKNDVIAEVNQGPHRYAVD